MAEHSVLDRDLAASMARASGFRNVAVHEYVAVRDDMVVANLALTADLKRFTTAVADWLS